MLTRVARRITMWYLSRLYRDATSMHADTPWEEQYISDVMYYVGTAWRIVHDGKDYLR